MALTGFIWGLEVGESDLGDGRRLEKEDDSHEMSRNDTRRRMMPDESEGDAVGQQKNDSTVDKAKRMIITG